MQIQTETVADSQRHFVRGELDADNCHQLTIVLGDGPTEDGSKPYASVVVDLEQVTFLDSSALSELLRIKTELEGSGIEFSIGAASPQVRRVLEITGLVGTFGLD